MIRRNRLLCGGVLLLGGLLMLPGFCLELPLLWGLGILVFLAGLAAERRLCRCPFCRRALGVFYQEGKFCPHCGCELRDVPCQSK